MILQQSELISIFHKLKNESNDYLQENDQSSSLKMVTSLELFTDNVQTFFDSIDLPSNFCPFEKLNNLTIYTILKVGDCENILKFIQILIGSNPRLNSLSLIIGNSKLNYRKFKQQVVSLPYEDIDSFKLSEDIIQQLKSLCKNFNFAYQDRYITFKYQYIWSNGIVLPKELIDCRNYHSQSSYERYYKTFSLFQNISFLKFVQLRDRTFSEVNGFFRQKVAFYQSLQVLKLEFENKIPIYDNTDLECQDILKTILTLPKLKMLELKIGKDLAYYIFNQFNSIEPRMLEESQIYSIKINVNTIRGTQPLNKIDLNFLGGFKKLKKLSIESKYYHVINLENALNDLNSQLDYLLLNIKIYDTTLDAVRKSLSNCKNLSFLNVQFINMYPSEQKIQVFTEDISSLKNLMVLNVTLKDIKYDNQELILLGKNFKHFHQLNELKLSLFNQKIDDHEFIGFVSGLKELSGLEILNLRIENENYFRDNSMFCLAESIKSLTQLNHVILVLHSQNISREGTLRVQQSLSTLKSYPYIFLDIIDYETIILQQLQITDLSLPPLHKKRYFKLISDDLLKLNKISSYYDLLLHNHYQMFVHSQRNKYKDLILKTTFQEISDIGYQGISNAFSSLTNLRKLFLVFESNQIRINVFPTIFENLLQLQYLFLHLEADWLEKQVVTQLYNGLKQMKHLEYLELFLKDYYQIDLDELNLTNLKKLSIRTALECKKFFQSIDNHSTLQEILFSNSIFFSQKQFEDFLVNLVLMKRMKSLQINLKFKQSEINQQCTKLFSVLKSFLWMTKLFMVLNTHRVKEAQEKNAKHNILKMKRLVKYQYSHSL